MPSFTWSSGGPVVREQDVVKRGALLKRSKFLGAYRPRHMVLTGQFLLSYEYAGQETVGAPATESLVLKECSTVRSAEDETGKSFAFKVESPGRTFLLVAENRDDKEAWIGAIAKCMVSGSASIITDY